MSQRSHKRQGAYMTLVMYAPIGFLKSTVKLTHRIFILNTHLYLFISQQTYQA